MKIVILPDYLEIARDGLGGLPDIVRDRVCISYHPSRDCRAGGAAVTVLTKQETTGDRVSGAEAGSWLTFQFL